MTPETLVLVTVLTAALVIRLLALAKQSWSKSKNEDLRNALNELNEVVTDVVIAAANTVVREAKKTKNSKLKTEDGERIKGEVVNTVLASLSNTAIKTLNTEFKNDALPLKIDSLVEVTVAAIKEE